MDEFSRAHVRSFDGITTAHIRSLVEPEEFAVPHRPKTVHQVQECTTPGEPGQVHAVHRKLTGLVHYSCNCGYSSGWVDESRMPPPGDFIAAHWPYETPPVVGL